MSTFDERGDAFENRYAHDAQIQFKVEARRNKLLGEWAAGLMGKSGDDVATYVSEVIKSDFEEAGDEDVFRKLAGDLGDAQSEEDIRAKMGECLVEAKKQILEETS